MIPTEATAAHKNIEVKARIRDYEKLITDVQALCLSHGETIQQEDVFFNVPGGRLKLRKRADYSVSELIYYDRPDTEGPKLSVYSKCNIPHGDDLLNILTMALGVRGVVKKTRHLYIHDQTRIHVDDVEGLGKFVELEIVLSKDQTPEDGQKVVESIMELLQIGKADLIDCAYLDLLNRSTTV
ncbi:hypothetical protein V9T40_006137 [Parthenolecanium corni]|uniref:CYTH domain-containing protein n=1 Tax=Parthenolecanium corni TaxID=536013 RepID=A0AAN9TXG0_9HEMI